MSEPTTVFTDYVLAVLAFVLARRLARGPAQPVSRRLWAASFLVLAVAAFAGGTWHGIPAQSSAPLRHHLWSITYVAIGVADMLILAGACWGAFRPRVRAVALGLLSARFLVYAALVLARREFRYVGYEYAATLLLLLAFGIDLLRREAAGGFVLAGALVSFAGGLVQATRFGLHAQFNHNDLFHVIQMLGLGLLFRGGLLLRDRSGAASTG